MTGRLRLLSDDGSSSPPHQHRSKKESASINKIDSEFVVILASLLCALICVLGFVAVIRCTWIRSAGRNASNRGVKKKVLNMLPRLIYGVDDSEEQEARKNLSECAICLAEFVAGEEIRVLPQCGHGFHVMCIDAWLRSHSSCPSCRQILGAAAGGHEFHGLPAPPATEQGVTHVSGSPPQ